MPYCTQCGNQVAESDTYCNQCGNRQQSATAPPPPFTPAADPLANLSPRTASILCYIPTVGWIASVVVLASRKFKDDHVVRFHAFQGLYLFALWLLVQWVIHPMVLAMPDSFIRVDRVLEGVILGVSIFMIIKTSHGEAYVLPVLGELAQRSVAEK